MRRSRTAAEVAAAEAEAQAEAAGEAERELKAREALEAAKAVDAEEKPSLEERAAALFRDLPAAEEPRGEQPTFATAPPATAAPAAPPPPPPSAASFGAPPRPVIPTPVRPKPVASAAPGGGPPAPPRPVASAAPGVGPLEERRRDKGKKRKKGKKSLVDQEAVAQNISRTLASVKSPVARMGMHRREEGPSLREVMEVKRREEKEREKTLVRVTEFITVSELASILKVPARDIVVLVVAADDAIMPQTIEAISHAKNAGVPIVVAINKIDLPTANVQKVKQDLLTHGVVLEEFGGTTLATPISAKTGQNVPELLDQILLQAELLDRKANPDRRAHGTVLEATLDSGKGALATVLVQNGTLHVGDDFICGQFYGRVRAMYDERGQTVDAAGPSTPVQVLGFEGVPEAGDTFQVMTDAAAARDIAQKRQRLEREAQHRRTGRVKTLEDFMAERAEGGAAALRIIIKADQGGPAEALADALAQLSTPEVKVEVVHRGVGAITDSDVLLAKASNAIIIGFHVRPDSNARASAEREKVEIRTYRIIYEAVEEVKAAMAGLLAPEKKEVVLGEAEVRQLFKIAKVGTIAGSFVRSGVIPRTARVRVVRDGVEVYDGTLASLKRFKDDVREVREGFECGIGVENFNDLKVGDLIEAYRIEEVARSLTPA